MREGIDFSGRPPTAEAMRAAGRDFVVRYARSFTHPKSITRDEVPYWRDAGIDVVIVEESSAARALAGRRAGRDDAAAARDAIADIGGPADGVIYSAVDFDATAGQMPAVLEYVRGFAEVLGHGRTGVYGSHGVVDAVHRAGACRYLWQTYAWSGGRQHPEMHLYQYRNAVQLGGVTVDYTRALKPDFGQWGAPTGGLHMDADVKAAFDALGSKLDSVLTRTGETLTRGRHVDTMLSENLRELLDDEGNLKASQDAATTAILAGLKALPTADLPDETIAQLGAEIGKAVPQLNADAVITALRNRITEQAGA